MRGGLGHDIHTSAVQGMDWAYSGKYGFALLYAYRPCLWSGFQRQEFQDIRRPNSGLYRCYSRGLFLKWADLFPYSHFVGALFGALVVVVLGEALAQIPCEDATSADDHSISIMKGAFVVSVSGQSAIDGVWYIW